MIEITDKARDLLNDFMDQLVADNPQLQDAESREDLDEAILDAIDDFEA